MSYDDDLSLSRELEIIHCSYYYFLLFLPPIIGISASATMINEYPQWRSYTTGDTLSPGCSYQFRVSAASQNFGYGHPSLPSGSRPSWLLNFCVALSCFTLFCYTLKNIKVSLNDLWCAFHGLLPIVIVWTFSCCINVKYSTWFLWFHCVK